MTAVTRTKKQLRKNAEAVASGHRVGSLHIGTWVGRHGETFCVHLDSKPNGTRVSVHRWYDNGEVNVRLISGNAFRDPAHFREMTNVTLVNPTNDDLAAAIAAAIAEKP